MWKLWLKMSKKKWVPSIVMQVAPNIVVALEGQELVEQNNVQIVKN